MVRRVRNCIRRSRHRGCCFSVGAVLRGSRLQSRLPRFSYRSFSGADAGRRFILFQSDSHDVSFSYRFELRVGFACSSVFAQLIGGVYRWQRTCCLPVGNLPNYFLSRRSYYPPPSGHVLIHWVPVNWAGGCPFSLLRWFSSLFWFFSHRICRVLHILPWICIYVFACRLID